MVDRPWDKWPMVAFRVKYNHIKGWNQTLKATIYGLAEPGEQLYFIVPGKDRQPVEKGDFYWPPKFKHYKMWILGWSTKTYKIRPGKYKFGVKLGNEIKWKNAEIKEENRTVDIKLESPHGGTSTVTNQSLEALKKALAKLAPSIGTGPVNNIHTKIDWLEHVIATISKSGNGLPPEVVELLRSLLNSVTGINHRGSEEVSKELTEIKEKLDGILGVLKKEQESDDDKKIVEELRRGFSEIVEKIVEEIRKLKIEPGPSPQPGPAPQPSPPTGPTPQPGPPTAPTPLPEPISAALAQIQALFNRMLALLSANSATIDSIKDILREILEKINEINFSDINPESVLATLQNVIDRLLEHLSHNEEHYDQEILQLLQSIYTWLKTNEANLRPLIINTTPPANDPQQIQRLLEELEILKQKIEAVEKELKLIDIHVRETNETVVKIAKSLRKIKALIGRMNPETIFQDMSTILEKLGEVIELIKSLSERSAHEDVFVANMEDIYAVLLLNLKAILAQVLRAQQRQQIPINTIEELVRKIESQLADIKQTLNREFQNLDRELAEIKQLLQRLTGRDSTHLSEEPGVYWYVWWKFDSERQFQDVKANYISPFSFPRGYGQRLNGNVKVMRGNIRFTDKEENWSRIIRPGCIIALGACRLPNKYEWRWDGKIAGGRGAEGATLRRTSDGRPISTEQVRRELRAGFEDLKRIQDIRQGLKREIMEVMQSEKKDHMKWEDELFWHENNKPNEKLVAVIQEIYPKASDILKTNSELDRIVKDITEPDVVSKIGRILELIQKIQRLAEGIQKCLSDISALNESERTRDNILRIEARTLPAKGNKKFIKTVLSLCGLLTTEEKAMEKILYREVQETQAA
jgi:DNA repair exonuclease SbcCD ATPase subunit